MMLPDAWPRAWSEPDTVPPISAAWWAVAGDEPEDEMHERFYAAALDEDGVDLASVVFLRLHSEVE